MGNLITALCIGIGVALGYEGGCYINSKLESKAVPATVPPTTLPPVDDTGN